MRLLVSLIMFATFLPTLAHSSKYPNVPFQVRGRVIDWDTKQPVEGVQVLVFMNGSPIASNNGWAGDHDFPNLPRSDSSGRFVGRARLYRGGPKIEVDYLDIIVLREGYRTERFRRNKPKVTINKNKTGGVVEIDDIELFKTKDK